MLGIRIRSLFYGFRVKSDSTLVVGENMPIIPVGPIYLDSIFIKERN